MVYPQLSDSDLHAFAYFFEADVPTDPGLEKTLEIIRRHLRRWSETFDSSVLCYIEKETGAVVFDLRDERADIFFLDLSSLNLLKAADNISSFAKLREIDSRIERIDALLARGLLIREGDLMLSVVNHHYSEFRLSTSQAQRMKNAVIAYQS
jgi:hypothetical protein